MSEAQLEQDKKLLLELKKGKIQAFEELYARYFKMAASFVQNNGGSGEDTKDVFQETLFVLVKKLRQPDFQLTAKLSTYTFSIVRHLWLKRLRQRGHYQLIEKDNQLETIPINEGDMEVKQEMERKHELIAQTMAKLNVECRQIILASYYEKQPHTEIAEKLGYAVKFVRVKLHRCMENLRKMVRKQAGVQPLK